LEKVFMENGASFAGVMSQADTYFNVPEGRLKFREINGERFEMIYYNRDESSPEEMKSTYDVIPFKDASMKELFARVLGVKVIVEKKRRLLLKRNARIHLDEVKNLGSYLEFEVVSTADGGDAGDAVLLHELKELAAPFVEEEINLSYSDLITRIKS